MSTTATARRLSQAVTRATRSARFCVEGTLPAVDPGLTVDGVGPVRWPLKGARAKALLACCRVAPYGKGGQTLVDRDVRNTWELDPQDFRLGDEWTAAVTRAAAQAAGQLGLPPERVEARLYKLLVYERGGFFLSHRDSEKHDGMLASLIVVLPNPFEGGELIVRHGAVSKTFRFKEAAAGRVPCFAAFYADCEHEVRRVSNGRRVCLAYNLVLTPPADQPAGRRPSPAAALTLAIQAWVTTRPARPLVFALEHHYTQRGLSLDLLKGADRQLADALLPAADVAGCLVHLAQVSRHLQQFADDGSFERDYYRRSRRGPLQIGETYEDELIATAWTDRAGKKLPWGDIALDLPAIVSTTPIDQWQPTSEEYEGYTGNAGNTLDRWYHRSALVLWHREHHFDVVASAGAAVSMPLFRSQVAKLARTPKKRLDEARRDCLRFAAGIMAHWSARGVRRWWLPDDREPSPLDDFSDLVLGLRDRDTAARFLSGVARQDPSLPLASFVKDAGRQFGCGALAGELKGLLAPRPDIQNQWPTPEHQQLLSRDLKWLAAFCLDNNPDPDRPALARELCALAVERFCVPPPPRPAYYPAGDQDRSTVTEPTLTTLLKAVLAGGTDEALARVLAFVEQWPDIFPLEKCQVPALAALLPWAKERSGGGPPRLAQWWASVRQKLASATAARPVPPPDWARAAEVACPCQYCRQLNAFLADPARETDRIKAREELRLHVAREIELHRCDVTQALDRKTSPYALVLTKTDASFRRATQRFEIDSRLLAVVDRLGRDTDVTDPGGPR